MGGSSKKTETTNSTTRTDPWGPAMPSVGNGLARVNELWADPTVARMTGTEQSAIQGLLGNASEGNRWAPNIAALTDELFTGGKDRTGMVQGAYDELRAGLRPYTTMETDPYKNDAFNKAVGYMSDDITNRIKSSYAGAGYSPATVGDFGQQLGEGISRGIAPTWLQASNDLEARKMGAMNALYAAGGQTAGLLSGMDQQSLANKTAGVDMSTNALQARDAGLERTLQLEQLRSSLPLSKVAQLSQLTLPYAQLGGTQNTQSVSTSETKVPVGQQIMGGIMGGVGLLSGTGAFGPTGWLLKGASTGAGLLGGGSSAASTGRGIFGGLY